jgi:NAD(P)-dependent dehydrogenase (short-subunit alcohol dehydrogenase family)
VITGGSRGIGKATALLFAREGCDVAICARSAGPLQEAASEIRAATGRHVYAATCDTTDRESIAAFIKGAADSLGGIDILINSAARVGGAPGTVEVVSDVDVMHDFEEKVVGYLRCAQQAIPYMKTAGWGRIINISGGAGRSPGQGVSGGARNAATINLTKSMANTLGKFGITANAIYPGQTFTEAVTERYAEQAREQGRSLEALLAEQAERTLINHLVNSEDVANVIVFLCSPLAIGITGEAIAVMGGSSSDAHY